MEPPLRAAMNAPRASTASRAARGEQLGAAPRDGRLVGEHLDAAPAALAGPSATGHGRLHALPSAAISSKPASGPQVPAT